MKLNLISSLTLFNNLTIPSMIALTNGLDSIISSKSLLLLLLLLLALSLFIIEIFFSTNGIAGIVSFLAFVLYFYFNLTWGNAEIMHVILFLVGCFLIVIEIFLPSLGIIGIIGAIMIGVGIFLSSSDVFTGIITLSSAIILSTILTTIIIKKGYRNKYLQKIILTDGKPKASNEEETNLSMLGASGKAITPLRPSGIIMINKERYDVITSGEFLSEGTDVIVVSVHGNVMKVREK